MEKKSALASSYMYLYTDVFQIGIYFVVDGNNWDVAMIFKLQR